MQRAALAAGLVAAVCAAVPTTAAAQEDETSYVYASYYECVGPVADAVSMLEQEWGPIVQNHMDAGHIGSWGVLTHDTGSPWSLGIYHIGQDLESLDTGLDAAMSELRNSNPESMGALREACPRHEDYIWTSGPGSQSGADLAQDRPGAGMTVYYVCDEGREAVADLILEHVMAPILDRQVTDGQLSSWAWLSHFVGGQYRRALVVDGADHTAILRARDQLIEEAAGEGALMAEFSAICNGHSDVLWDIALSRP